MKLLKVVICSPIMYASKYFLKPTFKSKGHCRQAFFVKFIGGIFRNTLIKKRSLNQTVSEWRGGGWYQ